MRAHLCPVTGLRLSDFDYALPEASIARHPVVRRDASRLMVVDRATSRINHHTFAELDVLLAPDDLLVVNDSKVMPARLNATKVATGGRVEVLLVEPVVNGRWRAILGSSKKVRTGAELAVVGSEHRIRVHEIEGEGFAIVELDAPVHQVLHGYGRLPLPPYIDRPEELDDRDRYQTVYARDDAERSVAAPTAGLHFTDDLFERMQRRGITRTSLTLHVGPGTFLPVRVENLDDHRMHSEAFELSAASARRIENARRVVAVGTTSTRVLESIGRPVVERMGRTDLFIRPGFDFGVVGAMVTNFHLPKSTLLMLVAAFAGRDLILRAYETAAEEGYRFFSYGDAMLIL